MKRPYVNNIIYSKTFSGFPRLSSTGTLSVLLQDENDNAPQFDQDKYTFKLKENNDPGLVLATLQARDADIGTNGQLTYTLSGDNSDAFTLDPLTGKDYKIVIIKEWHSFEFCF